MIACNVYILCANCPRTVVFITRDLNTCLCYQSHISLKLERNRVIYSNFKICIRMTDFSR